MRPGTVGPKAEESVNFDGYQTPVLATVLKAARAFVETQNIDVNTLEGVGVSATGQIDSRKGTVAGTCGNFPNYINSPIQPNWNGSSACPSPLPTMPTA